MTTNTFTKTMSGAVAIAAGTEIAETGTAYNAIGYFFGGFVTGVTVGIALGVALAHRVVRKTLKEIKNDIQETIQPQTH